MRIHCGIIKSNKQEIEVIKELKPKYLMLSYFYWKNFNMKDLQSYLGYKPISVLLDSGAYSALNKGIKIDINNYIDYIQLNKKYLTGYFNLDIIGSPDESYENYKYIRSFNLKPIPIIHYDTDYEPYLNLYINDYPNLIGLGGATTAKDKEVVKWIDSLKYKYPYENFHILGKSNRSITDTNILSCDSVAWIKKAGYGQPIYINGRINKAKDNLKKDIFISKITEIKRVYEELANS